jgi:type IV fimbrial biogenesis protein FimT
VAATNELFTALYLARTEAVKRGGRVSLCKSADGAACTRAGGYEQGWIVFEDPNADGVRADDEALIAGRDALGRAAVSGNRPVAHYVSYNAMGATRTASGALQMGTLTVCVGSDARRMVVSRAGRPRVEPGDC